MNRFIYLHGLASSPNSKKATAFEKAFDDLKLEIIIPDLENGDFKNLTISSQMRIIENGFDLISVDVSVSLPSVNEPEETGIVKKYIKNNPEQQELLKRVLKK